MLSGSGGLCLRAAAFGQSLVQPFTVRPRRSKLRAGSGIICLAMGSQLIVTKRLLILGEHLVIARLRDAKILRETAVEEACALELLKAREIGYRLKTEVKEKSFGRSICDRAAWRAPAAA